MCGPVVPTVVQIEPVRDCTEPLSEATTQPNELEPPTQQSPTTDVLEVRNSSDTLVIDLNPDSDNSEPVTVAEEEERYMLPPRSNRGISPRRYSPEHQSRASRYPVANLVRGSMTNEARAFVAFMTALYTEGIPKGVQEIGRAHV